MNTKFLVPLCFAAALMACGDRNNDTGVGGETSTGTPETTAPDSTTGTADMPPADPNVTPGTPSTPADMPPADTAPADTPPPPPNQ